MDAVWPPPVTSGRPSSKFTLRRAVPALSYNIYLLYQQPIRQTQTQLSLLFSVIAITAPIVQSQLPSMCSNQQSTDQTADLPGSDPALASLADYQHRLHQLYAQQAFRAATVAAHLQSAPSHLFGGHNTLDTSPFAHISPFTARYVDSRYRIEEPKPSCSYIGLIAMAILSSAEKKMVLSDIYQYILDHYPYFRNRGPGWRNSIRHNLSLNDCFIKSGRSANGKGHYWAIHPANIEDFMKGDFRRRKAQRKVRKHLGLSVPDDEDSDSPAPTPPALSNSGGPVSGSPSTSNNRHMMQLSPQPIAPSACMNVLAGFPYPSSSRTPPTTIFKPDLFESLSSHLMLPPARSSKRLFDVESLLAPDLASRGEGGNNNNHNHHNHSNTGNSSNKLNSRHLQHSTNSSSTTDGSEVHGGGSKGVNEPGDSGSPRTPASANSPSECRASDSSCSSPSVTSSSPQPPVSSQATSVLDATGLAQVWLQSPTIQSLTNLQQVNAAAAAAAMAGLMNVQAATTGLPTWTSAASLSQQSALTFAPGPSSNSGKNTSPK